MRLVNQSAARWRTTPVGVRSTVLHTGEDSMQCKQERSSESFAAYWPPAG